MIVLPEGIYHRFTLDTNNYIKVRPDVQTQPACAQPMWVIQRKPALGRSPAHERALPPPMHAP